MTAKRREERQRKLEILHKFYIRFKDNSNGMVINCPFSTINSKDEKFENMSCMFLCYQFDLLITDEEYNCCPCGWFGRKEALRRLEMTLKKNNMLKEEDLIYGN